MIATDPLSLLFIACFLTGLVFFVVTALLGNLGHGMTHNVAHHVGAMHTTSTHAASNGPAHTGGQAAGSHGTSKPMQAHKDSTRLPFLSSIRLRLCFSCLGLAFLVTSSIIQSMPLQQSR